MYNIEKLKHTDTGNFLLIAGPCVIEDEESPFEIARELAGVADKYELPFIFKASYKKANRSRLDSFTGIGDKKGLKVLQKIGKQLDIPVITDFHSAGEARLAAKHVDILQVPAFLCRQTEILVAAAETGKTVNIKKGQFLSPEAMTFAVNKVKDSGNPNIMVTERGTTFGYQDLVVDFRGIPVMQQNNVPVIMDITHSLQRPNQTSGVTGGQPGMIETISKAAIASGSDGIFIETHPNPSQAKSDGANMLQLDKLEELIVKLKRIRHAL